MKHLIYLVVFLPLLSSCFCDDPQDVYLPPIPDSILNLIPYAKNQSITLVHSGGLEIQYQINRFTEVQESWCEFCCDYVYHYEVNTTQLVPDYNLPMLSFQLYSPDSVFFLLSLNTGNSSFEIPFSYLPENINYQATLLDTFRLDSISYFNVFAIKGVSYQFNNDQIFFDSLYYNYSHGIIKLLTNYEESYILKP
jgi:hypothetical protein